MKVVLLGNGSQKEVEKRIQIVASAGNLSRANGTVTDVIRKHNNYESNLKLARAIVGYGHKSIAEHDYLVFALENVTPIVEQALISYRLTSFTIKSRRNVDFRNVGFYVPNFKNSNGEILKNNKEIQKEYKKYMKSLFKKYGNFVDMELPVEDARYILPYCYYSNIIMGCDANEFLRITSDMLYGKISKITEIKELGIEFSKIIKDKIPYLYKALENEKDKDYNDDKFSYLYDFKPLNVDLLKGVELVNYTQNADEIVFNSIIASRYQISLKEANKILKNLERENLDIKEKLINSLIQSKSQRELEQVSYTFSFPISLAVLTHITRHRMHSMLIPDFVPMWNLNNYVIPPSIKNNNLEEYKKVFLENKIMFDKFKKYGIREEDLIYFYLSGNACNIMTTMNGRTLEWISRMRCCTKAQWEIRNIANNMVDLIKNVSPYIYKTLGPTCKVLNYCPEGKDSCKNRGVVIIKK